MLRWISAFALLATLSFPAELKLERVVELKGATYHVQGVEFDSKFVWATSVDAQHQKGYLHEFLLSTGQLLRQVEVEDGIQFHAGGIASDGSSLWIPVAEYRRNSSSVIERRSKRTLDLEFQFSVPDHIGCIAATPQYLVGGNWDSKEFYVWDHRGREIRRVTNSSANAYQDMKFDGKRIVASGLLPDRTGAIDRLEFPSLRFERRLPVGNTEQGLPLTREGMAIHGKQIMLLPEDGPSRLFVFTLDSGK